MSADGPTVDGVPLLQGRTAGDLPEPGLVRGLPRRHLSPTAYQRLRRWRHPSLEVEAEALRQWLGAREERRMLADVRGPDGLAWSSHEDEPLVTVRIATYGTADLVVRRAIASALRQTYSRLDVLVVGDCTHQETVDAVAAVRDPRVRMVNLGQRFPYPRADFARWRVAGSLPMAVGNHLARGAWITPCDDDDELTDDHVEVLLAEAQRRRLEMVWSDTLRQLPDESWAVSGGAVLRDGLVTNGSVLFAGPLSFFANDPGTWRRGEPHDFNVWRRMAVAGVRMGHLPRVTYVYHQDSLVRRGLTDPHA